MTAPLAVSPDWLGSPQHFVAGLVLGIAVTILAVRRLRLDPLVSAVLAIGVTSAAEIVVELVEWPLAYHSRLHATAYLDTLADLANTLVGGIIGAAFAVWWVRRRRTAQALC